MAQPCPLPRWLGGVLCAWLSRLSVVHSALNFCACHSSQLAYSSRVGVLHSSKLKLPALSETTAFRPEWLRTSCIRSRWNG